MFESKDQILDQLRAGEDGRAEFKEVRFGNRGIVSPNTEELAGELVAFANAEGGVVFLGVDDSGTVRGVPPARIDAVEQWMLDVATHNCDPPIRPILRKALLPGDGGDDERVLLVEVPHGLYVHRTSGGRYYARLGSTKRDLTPPELVRLFQQRGREYVFDEQPILATTVDDLNRHRLEAFFGRSPTIPWLDLLRNTRVTYRDEDGVDRPTVAGLLVFGTEPSGFLPSGSIEAACYRGTRLSSDDLIHAERLAGPVSDQIDAGIAFVARFMQAAPPSQRTRDKDGAPYDLDVVDEAIVNAVAHRDYAISGAKIRLFLFADRLELYSPGKLPNTLTLDDMPYRTFTRNQLLVSFLSRIRSKRTGQVFLESRGEGVRKILQDGEAYSGRRPEYELFGDELRLTLWGRSNRQEPQPMTRPTPPPGLGAAGESRSMEMNNQARNRAISMKVSVQKAEEEISRIPHRSCQDGFGTRWHVCRDENGQEQARAQSICWLYCWAVTGQGSRKAQEAARQAFDNIFDRSFDWLRPRLPLSEARRLRYTPEHSDIEQEFADIVGTDRHGCTPAPPS